MGRYYNLYCSFLWKACDLKLRDGIHFYIYDSGFLYNTASGVKKVFVGSFHFFYI